MIKRCFGGNTNFRNYVGDLKCWPFSTSQTFRGLWLIRLEGSVFYPGAQRLRDIENRDSSIYLRTDLIDQRPEMLAAAQGAGDLVYAVKVKGRMSLCDGFYGGAAKRELIAEKFNSIRLLRPHS